MTQDKGRRKPFYFFIILLVFLIYFSQTFLGAIIALGALYAVICLAVKEFLDIAIHKGFSPPKLLTIWMSLIYALGVTLATFFPSLRLVPHFILLSTLLLILLSQFGHQTNKIGSASVAIFAFVFAALPLTFIIKINYLNLDGIVQSGSSWLAYVLIITKITDIGAYHFGKKYGKAKLALHISPQKTIIGSIGGTLTAVIASICFYLLLRGSPHAITFVQSIWISLLLSILSQLGDLSESVLKRDAGIKESSSFSNLGGVLDMSDSLTFTLPCMYLLLQQGLVGSW